MKLNNIQPRVTLVGAGPGDIELITIKGLKAIQKADVILYDALVNEDLLNEAPNAKHIFVGKRKGFKAYSQDEINRLIVENAFLYGNVVRLKGGDSFVFGRGFEEIQFVEAFGIPTQIIPGISSSISVPALAGIPVTHRNLSNSFYVLTGTLSDGALNPEIKNAALSNGTVVVLMGLSKLSEIVQVFKLMGKSNHSIAVISNGSLPTEKTVVAKVDTIEKIVENEGVKAPAIILIGDVVDLQKKYDSILEEVFLNK
jgi:uroporphyrin-III C-methyltransferase